MRSTTPTKSRAEQAEGERGTSRLVGKVTQAEGEVERGNHTKRIHDRHNRKVFYPADRGSKTRQKTKPQVSVLMPGIAQRG